jgi:hypothetical protein
MIEIILPVIAPVAAAIISVGGGMVGAKISRSAEQRRKAKEEQQALGQSVALLNQGLDAVVNKLEEIRAEWQLDRRDFHIWQQRVETRLSHVEAAAGVMRVVPPICPFPEDPPARG